VLKTECPFFAIKYLNLVSYQTTKDCLTSWFNTLCSPAL
jgi:hypothetical protein